MFSHRIAIVVPDVTNQFFSELAQQVQRHVVSVNGAGILFSSDGRRDLEARHLELIGGLGLDGLVFVSVGDNHDVYEVLSTGRMPYVVLDREVPDSTNCDFVLSDNVYGTRLAVRHALDSGHYRLGYVAGDMTTEPGRARFEAYREEAARLSIVGAEDWTFYGDFTFHSGRVAGEHFLRCRERPTLILCANDFMAVGLIQTLAQGGLNVPGDISVIGYDDIPLASWIYPRLTTVRQEVGELARQAVNVLMQRLDWIAAGEGPEHSPVLRAVLPRLIIRDSVKTL